MSKDFHNTDPYAGTPDQMWAMLSDQDYWQQKYDALGATDLQWHRFNADESTLAISSTRQVPANLPGFAKKIIGETALVTQSENWRRDGDQLACDIEITTKGAPGGTTGTMKVTPDGNGSTWTADFTIKVSIPLVGGKLENLMLNETQESFRAEKEFNDAWLAR
ncbi:MAG: DUF2505 domain-containing protein [Candidatus Nanopelagicales bacterium]|nr:DUF2505 domain-containing protein [Candidatus Nanopelagicales bacterium]